MRCPNSNERRDLPIPPVAIIDKSRISGLFNRVEISPDNKFGFVQGMMVMATYIPQALIYYNIIVPQTIEPELIITAIIALGTLKVVLIFGWHSAIAFLASRVQSQVGNNRFGKAFEIATASLIVGLGINILI